MSRLRLRGGRCAEKIFCYMLVLVITPCFYIFEMSIVRPIVVKTYNFNAIKQVFHVILSTFFFTNIIGNMMLCIFTETSLKGSDVFDRSSEHYCDKCETNRPATAWHCASCDACVLRRDHHCFFLSRCIGLRNQRYYVLYVGYVFLSMLYSTYYNYYYVLTKFADHDLYLSAVRVINPFLRYVLPEPLCMRDLYVLFLFLNTGLVAWSGGLFWFHMRNVLRGVTARECKNSCALSWSIMRRNFKDVFGTRWYLAVIWPFADSPLPNKSIK